VPNHGTTITEARPLLVDSPPAARPGSGDMLRELCSLGLTHEASVGILKYLMGSTTRRAAYDPSEW
jgi:hypothetical protein